jgi:hypothetical protein
MSDSNASFLPARVSIPNLIFGLVGFAVSLYALYLHITAKAGSLSCDVNEVVNCLGYHTQVNSSFRQMDGALAADI